MSLLKIAFILLSCTSFFALRSSAIFSWVKIDVLRDDNHGISTGIIRKFEEIQYPAVLTTGSDVAQHENCIICLLPLNSAKYLVLNCGHVFHKHCFAHWGSLTKLLCPTCKGFANTVFLPLANAVSDNKFKHIKSRLQKQLIDGSRKVKKRKRFTEFDFTALNLFTNHSTRPRTLIQRILMSFGLKPKR